MADETVRDASEKHEILSTGRTAMARVQNLWNDTLASVTLRHIFGNDPTNTETFTWQNVAINTTTAASLTVLYSTGIFTSHDYWFVSFILTNGDLYQSKGSFYCDLLAEDDGGIVTATVNAQDGSLTINCPVSSSCTTASIQKQ